MAAVFYNAGVKTWDAIIVGGGIVGLSLARELRKCSASVLVLERGQPGRESSSAAAGMLVETGTEVPQPLKPLAAASARMYPEFVEELQDESGLDVDYRREGSILLGGDSFVSSSNTLSSNELARLEPHLKVAAAATFFADASVDPRALVHAAHEACKHRGVQVSSGEEVTSIDLINGRVTGVITSKTRFPGASVINCAGAWAGQFPPCPFPTRPRKGQMLAVAMPSRDFVRHVIRAPDVYLVPRSDGRLLVGATVEDVGYDKRVDPRTIHRLHRAAMNLVPGLTEARLLEDWAGLRPGTPDDLPILGATQVPGYFVAAGHFRDGILLSPITAQIMAQVVTGLKPAFDLSPFSADRF
ncbi:MAG TPA: glycine oxidase ThiO [Terriglobales bacterium]|nr:glycine oxidase ThiO [Terriglobales bacterium]